MIDKGLSTPSNPVYGTEGDTWPRYDWVTILSAQESTNSAYGFYMNEYIKTTLTSSTQNDMTDSDPNRVALDTSYVANLVGYRMRRDKTDEKGGGDELWWLRTPGYDTTRACTVNRNGCTRVYGSSVYEDLIGVRPVIHLLLSSARNYWTYAGTVTADYGPDTGFK